MPKNDITLAPETGFLALAQEAGKRGFAETIKANAGPGGITPADLQRVKIPSAGGRAWDLGEDEVAQEFEGVILHHRDIRAFWKDKAVGEHRPPDCYSPDAEVGLCTDAALSAKLGIGGDCSKCPMSQWGTAMDEKGNATKGQACALRKMMLILRPGSYLPVVLSVPPSSLKSVRQYMLRLANKGTIYNGVTTVFALSSDKSANGITYSQVTPKRGRELTPAEVQGLVEYAHAVLPAFESAVEDAAPSEE